MLRAPRNLPTGLFLRAMASTRPESSSAVVTKIRSPTTSGDACPLPGSDTRQATFSASLQTVGQSAITAQLSAAIPPSPANHQR